LELRTGDAEAILPTLGQFDLIFADAEGGKWSGLDLTLHALNPGAILLVDDMQVDRYSDPAQRAAITRVREMLMTDARLVVADLPVSSGIMLATRHASEPSHD
jgi:demethylmenaquinone methyltransferase/2-methoxy-6-polyprenyl-1,4-benzoquinol methylase